LQVSSTQVAGACSGRRVNVSEVAGRAGSGSGECCAAVGIAGVNATFIR